MGDRDGAVERALASHTCIPGSIPGPGVMWVYSLLLGEGEGERVTLEECDL